MVFERTNRPGCIKLTGKALSSPSSRETCQIRHFRSAPALFLQFTFVDFHPVKFEGHRRYIAVFRRVLSSRDFVYKIIDFSGNIFPSFRRGSWLLSFIIAEFSIVCWQFSDYLVTIALKTAPAIIQLSLFCHITWPIWQLLPHNCPSRRGYFCDFS